MNNVDIPNINMVALQERDTNHAGERHGDCGERPGDEDGRAALLVCGELDEVEYGGHAEEREDTADCADGGGRRVVGVVRMVRRTQDAVSEYPERFLVKFYLSA